MYAQSFALNKVLPVSLHTPKGRAQLLAYYRHRSLGSHGELVWKSEI